MRRIVSFLVIYLCVQSFAFAQGVPWTAPKLNIHTDELPTDVSFLLYNVDQGQYLSKGSTWGTHAVLVDNAESALTYNCIQYSGYFQLQCTDGNYLFVDSDGDYGCEVYYDYQPARKPISTTYFTREDGGNDGFLIKATTDNAYYMANKPYLGWNPNAHDKSSNGTSLSTNIGLYLVNPSISGVGIHWGYVTSEDADIFAARQKLYDLLCTYYQNGHDVSEYAEESAVYYNNASSLAELTAAYSSLNYKNADYPIDVTSEIVNPSFVSDVNGWTVNMPSAHNKGWQNNSYTGSGAYLNKFAEAWIPQGNSVGQGSILQTIIGLPDGKYVLEVDAIACDQSGANTPSTGVNLVAESDVAYSTEIASAVNTPAHFVLTFICEGGKLTLGLRTDADATANWVAFDNVQLTYWGPISCETTDIYIEETNLELVEGETYQLNAVIETNDEIFEKASWWSSNEDVAIVDQNGQITALKKGTATIYAKAVNTELQASCTVNVVISDITGLVINELQSMNVDQYFDPGYNFSGWVELYNPTSTNMNLALMYVSDDPTNLMKFQLPSSIGVLQAGGYKNIWFDHNGAEGNYGNHTECNVNFKLNVEGGSIYLSNSEGNLIASLTYPAGVPRCAYALNEEGVWGMTATPTPEESNADIILSNNRLEAPVISSDGGLISSGQSIDFNVEIPAGAILRYTTDGVTPSLEYGSTSLDGHFTANGTSIFRFALFHDGYLPSPVITRSFIETSNRMIPVVNVVTDRTNLYDGKAGIWVAGDGTNGVIGDGSNSPVNFNMDWDRPVNLEYFVPSDGGSITVLNQEVDMSVAGGWSRASEPRPFKLKASKKYELKNYLEYPFFPEKPFVKNRTLQFRNNEGDNLHDAGLAEIALKSGLDLDVQAWQPSEVYFNGVRMGYYPIRQPNNKQFALADRGVDTDSIDVFEFHYSRQYQQTAGTRDAFDRWLELSENAADAQTYQEICELVDVDEVINYLCFELYCGNNDWPWNNLKGYRPYGGKFRMVLMDIGDRLCQIDDPFTNFTESSYSWYGGKSHDFVTIIENMLNNDEFSRKFVDTFCLMGGSVFNSARVSEVLDEMQQRFNGYMTPSTSKFDTAVSSQWKSQMMTRLQEFGVLDLDANKKMNISLKSNVNEAKLEINGIELPFNAFDGALYAPLTLSAHAPAGYTFKGWMSNNSTQSVSQSLMTINHDWYYWDQGSLDGVEWKSPQLDAAQQGWKAGQAPLGYGNTGINYQQPDFNTELTHNLPTYYFRTVVNLDNAPSTGETFSMKAYFDDGFRVYVNGQNAYGYGVSEGADYNTLSSSNVSYAASVQTFDLDASLFHKGENVIAVEVHNMTTGSSDIYWTAELYRNSEVLAGDIVSTDEVMQIDTADDYQLIAVYEQANDEQVAPIRINEISAANDIYVNEYWDRNDWIELYNMTSEDIDVAGMYLSDSQKKPQKWQISNVAADGVTPVNTIIPAHGHLVVWCDHLSPISQLHTGFKLNNADGACVSIQAEDGSWADRLTYLAQPRWHTFGRYPDGGNQELLTSQPSIGEANHVGLFDYANSSNTLSDDINITLALAEGWNWVSHNLAENVDKSRFTGYAEIIRGRSNELFKDDVLGWVGTLSTLDATLGYKVKMSQAADITLRGDLYDTMKPVSVLRGWNWIGFPLSNATTLEAALQNYSAREGEQIVGQDAFAVYTGGSWTGSLTSLQPGQAYLMKTTYTQDFAWNALSGNKLRQRRYVTSRLDDVTPWELNIHAYPNVMTMIAKVDAEGIDLADGYHVGVFCDEECRGVAQIVDDRLFVNIHGQSNENLTFKLMDVNGDIFTSSQSAVMSNLSMMGTYDAPYTLHFSNGLVDDIMTVTGDRDRVVNHTYYNMSGQRIARPTQGVYIEKVTYSSGKTSSKVVRY